MKKIENKELDFAPLGGEREQTGKEQGNQNQHELLLQKGQLRAELGYPRIIGKHFPWTKRSFLRKEH